MDQKWILLLGILVFYQRMTSGAAEDKIITEGQSVDITCNTRESGMVTWFRVLDRYGVEFIASYNNAVKRQSITKPSSTFSDRNIQQNVLTLQSFKKDRDSGIYTCATVKSTELKFGQLTRLVGEKDPVTVRPQLPSITKTPEPKCPTVPGCDHTNGNKREETSSSMTCPLFILAPLAGGCGLLLLFLIITILYCNKIRTRRCPHHYRRKPRMMEPGKQMMTNRHG